MTDLSRGARVRRGGRRPGWVLLTALLVLAIGASSALVFTNRVELLKLAVILALWAAVVAAFVSVIYRRQSDVDQARARDLKLVYDLQLDREISARREYELTVESQLRRELASELVAQSSDEVAALRAELAALRTNLEILFDAELSDRPALETERKTVQSDWEREHESARERINRVASVRAEEPTKRQDDNSIIDVHEEPLVPTPPRQPAETYHPAYTYQPADAYPPPRRRRSAESAPHVQEGEAERGSHWRQNAQEARAARDEATPPEGWAPPPPPPAAEPPPAPAAERQPESRGWITPDRPSQAGGWPGPTASPASEAERFEPKPPRRSHRRPEPQFAPPPEPQFAPPQPPPEPPPQMQRPGWPPPAETPRPQEPQAWQRESAGSVSWAYDNAPPRDKPADRPLSAAESAEHAERRGRHSSAAAEQAPAQTGDPLADWSEPSRRSGSRHAAELSDSGTGVSGTPPPAMSPPPPPMPPPPTLSIDKEPAMSPPPSARHRGSDPLSETDEPQSGGQSVAELLARLQSTPSEGGRRRRRED